MPFALSFPSRLLPALGPTGRAALSLGVLREKWRDKGGRGVLSASLRLIGIAVYWRQHAALLREMSLPGARAVVSAFPRAPYRYTLPYLSTSLGWQARWAALRTHYAFINTVCRPAFTEQVLAGSIVLWERGEGGARLSVNLEGLCAVTRHREGEMTLCARLAGEAVFKLSFSVVDLHALSARGPGQTANQSKPAWTIFVGRVQGVPGRMNALREATAIAGAVAPQDLLMAVLGGLAMAWGITSLLGVSDACSVSRQDMNRSGCAFQYDAFWGRHGGRHEPRHGLHHVALPVAEKPLEDIAPKHRKRTLGKRRFKHQVGVSAASAIRDWLR